MLDHLINNSTSPFANNLMTIQEYIFQAKYYNDQYYSLEARQQQLKIATKMMRKHQQNIKAKRALTEVRNNAKNKQDIQKWLKDLQKWSINSYKVITSFRKFVTGQTLSYHILDSNKKHVYEVNEDQFLELLSQKNMDFGRRSTATVNQALKKGVPLADLFELRVGTTMQRDPHKTALQTWVDKQNEGKSIPLTEQKQDVITVRTIGNDVLYNYLVARAKNLVALQSSQGKASHAKIFELYDQLYYSFKWLKSKAGSNKIAKLTGSNTIEGFTIERKQAMDNFITNYLSDIVANSSDTFYGAGDTIQNENIIIENKMVNATVSVKTIKDAIQEIAHLTMSNVAQLKSKLKQLFAIKGQGLIADIRKEAYEKAVKHINDLFKTR